MLYLAPIFLLVIAYLTGEILSTILRDKNSNIAEKCLIGTFALLVIFEGFVLVAQRINLSFNRMCIFYSVLLILIVAINAVFLSKRIYENLVVKEPISIEPIVMIVVIILIQVAGFFILMPDVTADYTLETVNTTIVSDSIYKYNPGTGKVFQNGLTLRGGIVTLPIFYAYLEKVFNHVSISGNDFTGNIACLIYRAIPTWGLLLSFICYGTWANYLFKKDKRIQLKVAIFLTGLGLLNICGMFSKNCIFYNQMFRGFRGETICFSVIIPYAIYCLMKMINNKNNVKWINVLLALLCTVMLVDYQKGFVPTVIAILICIAIHFINRLGRWLKCRQP